jgi:O-succinylbenzoic acid--CoA ligase
MLNIFENINSTSKIYFENRVIPLYDIFEESKLISLHQIECKEKYISIITKNSFSFIKHLLAIWNNGLIPVPINYQLNSAQIKEMLNSINCSNLIVDSDVKEKYTSVCKTVLSFEELDKSNSINNKHNNTSVVLFTSGSTSFPKAVPLSFYNFDEHYKSIKERFNLSKNDNWLASLPFYHIGGFAIIMRAFMSGANLSLVNLYKTDEIISAVNKFNPTHISLVPTQLIEIVNKNINPNINHKSLFLGGGPSDNDIVKSAAELGWNIIKVYGSTETCSMVSSVSIKDTPNKINSSGKAFDENEIIIVDDKMNPLSNNHIGEIIIKSNSLSSGYINSDNSQFSSLGFLTKDFGYIDDDEFLHIEMRREDLIVTGGENVNPFEIETVIKNFDFVEDSVVIGIDDFKWGQKICAVVQTKSKVNIDNFMKELKSFLPSFQVPKQIIIVDSIPRNEMGKVNRIEVKKLFVKS